jgi:hypothetical protein
MNYQVFVSTFGMRFGTLDMSALQLQLIKLGAASVVEGEESSAFESTIAGTQDLGFSCRQKNYVARAFVAQQVSVANIQTARDLPQEANSGHAFAGFNLAEHRTAYAGKSGKALHAKPAALTQPFDILSNPALKILGFSIKHSHLVFRGRHSAHCS